MRSVSSCRRVVMKTLVASEAISCAKANHVAEVCRTSRIIGPQAPVLEREKKIRARTIDDIGDRRPVARKPGIDGVFGDHRTRVYLPGEWVVDSVAGIELQPFSYLALQLCPAAHVIQGTRNLRRAFIEVNIVDVASATESAQRRSTICTRRECKMPADRQTQIDGAGPRIEPLLVTCFMRAEVTTRANFRPGVRIA